MNLLPPELVGEIGRYVPPEFHSAYRQAVPHQRDYYYTGTPLMMEYGVTGPLNRRQYDVLEELDAVWKRKQPIYPDVIDKLSRFAPADRAQLLRRALREIEAQAPETLYYIQGKGQAAKRGFFVGVKPTVRDALISQAFTEAAPLPVDLENKLLSLPEQSNSSGSGSQVSLRLKVHTYSPRLLELKLYALEVSAPFYGDPTQLVKYMTQANLAQLRQLKMTHLGLTKFPESLGLFSGLYELDFSHNHLTSYTNFALAPKLLQLHLSHNLLSTIPPGLEDAPILDLLDLSYNRLTILPHQLFVQRRLQRLNLSHNDFGDRSEPFFSVKPIGERQNLLRELDLSFCGLSVVPAILYEVLPYRTSSHIQNLHRLKLSYNYLRAVELVPQEKNDKVQIDLSYNRLTQVSFLEHTRVRDILLKPREKVIHSLNLRHNRLRELIVPVDMTVEVLLLEYNPLR